MLNKQGLALSPSPDDSVAKPPAVPTCSEVESPFHLLKSSHTLRGLWNKSFPIGLRTSSTHTTLRTQQRNADTWVSSQPTGVRVLLELGAQESAFYQAAGDGFNTRQSLRKWDKNGIPVPWFHPPERHHSFHFLYVLSKVSYAGISMQISYTNII